MTIDTEHFKKKLEDEKRLLVEELSNIGAINPQNSSDWEAVLKKEESMDTADPNVAADRHEEYEKRHAIIDELEIRLHNVGDALKRIEEGTFGVCKIGGEQIEEDRLNANPAARTCKKHLND